MSTESDGHQEQQLPESAEIRPRRAFPTVWQAVILCAAFVFIQIALGVCVHLSILLYGKLTGVEVVPDLPITLTAVINLAAFAAVCFLAWLWSGCPLKELFPTARFDVRLLLPMAVTVLGAHVLLSEVDNVVRRIIPVPDMVIEMFRDLIGFSWASVLLLVVVAPLTEEPFFRGIVLGGFRKNYGPVLAASLSALLFGMVHLNPWQFLGAFLLGLLFSWWLMRTESLWPCIFGHALSNGLSVLMMLFPLPIPGYNALYAETPFQPLWFDLTGLGLLLFGIGWTKRFFVSSRNEEATGGTE